MQVSQFQMSERTRAALQTSMEPLTVEQRSKLLDSIASLSAEIQLHCRKLTIEELCKQWSDALQTMTLRMDLPSASIAR